MSVFFSTLLTFFEMYSYPALWGIVFLAATGAPFPITVLLGTAGALAALGNFNIFWLAAVTISASVCGDSFGYMIGRKWGSRAFARLAGTPIAKHLFRSDVPSEAHTFFKRYGGWAVFLSRFLFSFFGGTINLLAGSQGFPYRLFLLGDIAGEMVGAVLPLILGWSFGAGWKATGGALDLILLCLFSLLGIVILLMRLLHQRKPGKQDTVHDLSERFNVNDAKIRVLSKQSDGRSDIRAIVWRLFHWYSGQ